MPTASRPTGTNRRTALLRQIRPADRELSGRLVHAGGLRHRYLRCQDHVGGCARRIDGGEAAIKELSIVKTFTTEATFHAIDRCIQVCGALGLTNEMRLVEAWLHARMVQIADGTGQIMRRNIARQILGHGPGR
jgi:alkylation response protein AidB-like acyl-CoA dehydrogenase